jgi:hypothetical protein
MKANTMSPTSKSLKQLVSSLRRAFIVRMVEKTVSVNHNPTKGWRLASGSKIRISTTASKSADRENPSKYCGECLSFFGKRKPGCDLLGGSRSERWKLNRIVSMSRLLEANANDKASLVSDSRPRQILWQFSTSSSRGSDGRYSWFLILKLPVQSLRNRELTIVQYGTK